ncbi:MAG TPA: RsmD family RNA methyltransferase [Candidatus Limnocylindrales bacterium]
MGDDYELLDAGDGRRLERFGRQIVDRPAPAAESRPLTPDAWKGATLRYDRRPDGSAGWRPADVRPWTVSTGGLEFELRPAAGGQVGLFPEHLGLAGWVAGRVAAVASAGKPPSVLNLFAYTGATTLVAARVGARVAHVDASATAVEWARRNAALSGLVDCPIRWLVEDAARFVRREAARGRRYQGVVLDPPTYGHGTGGRAWRLGEDLPPLLEAISQLLDPAGGFVLLTAHARDLSSADLAAAVESAAETRPGAVESGGLEVVARSGARLAAGVFARWPK